MLNARQSCLSLAWGIVVRDSRILREKNTNIPSFLMTDKHGCIAAEIIVKLKKKVGKSILLLFLISESQ
jgi:hypothetical protein